MSLSRAKNARINILHAVHPTSRPPSLTILQYRPHTHTAPCHRPALKPPLRPHFAVFPKAQRCLSSVGPSCEFNFNTSSQSCMERAGTRAGVWAAAAAPRALATVLPLGIVGNRVTGRICVRARARASPWRGHQSPPKTAVTQNHPPKESESSSAWCVCACVCVRSSPRRASDIVEFAFWKRDARVNFTCLATRGGETYSDNARKAF